MLTLPPVICLPDRTVPAVRPTVMPQAQVATETGQFFFRGAILDQLDDYMIYLKRMRRGDPQAYALYSKIGVGIYPLLNHPSSEHIEHHELAPWFRDTLPMFGAIAGLSREREAWETEKEHIFPRFMWFTKYARSRSPPEVELASDGAMYKCAVYWDKYSLVKLKRGVPQEFPLVVQPDGRVRILRSRLNETQLIRHKHGARRGYTSEVHHQRWGIWHGFLTWAREHNQDPQEFLARQFIHCANTYQAVNSGMIRVSAAKDGVAAMFGVDVTRTPYFFADRDLTVNQNGTRRRIFHVVRAHVRANGRGVRLHFRGQRRFRWNGYDVHITVPGLEHYNIAEMNMGAWDSHWEGEMNGDRLEEPEFAGRLASMIGAAGNWPAVKAAFLGAPP